MGLRINTNILSLNAQRNLQNTSKSLGRSLERLSSGSRINRAGDDAAGLAISEGLTAQVRGLRQAVRNANDSLGFLNTAEGALAEMTNITQRLRELSIQGANGAIGNKERGFLDDELEALLEEFNRIATQTEFNGTKLLDGSFVETDLQVGVNKGESISFTIGDARSTSLGALAVKEGAQNTLSSGFSNVTLGSGNTALTVDASDDALSRVGNGYSAIAVAKAAQEIEGTTGISATAQETVVKINNIREGALTSVGAISENTFEINGVDIVGDVSSVDNFVSLVNDFSSSTGVKARLQSGSTTSIELYATDGRNIDIKLASASSAITTGLQLSDGNFSSGGIGFTGSAELFEAFINSANVRNSINGQNVLFGDVSAGATAVSNAVSAAAAGLVGSTNGLFTSAVELRSANAIIIGGTSTSQAFGFSDTVVAVDSDNALFSVDISTQDNAQNALQTVDATLSQLNELRSSLGAVQNRLESTIRNLSISLENISAAQSQIRDADIAAETAELTRAQILQQAGIAVLGQANASSQVALSLLQF